MNEKLDYIVIDFETANQHRNSACSVGLVRFINGQEVDSVSALIHPAKMYFIPEWTDTIHGISYDDVKNEPLFPEVWNNTVTPFLNSTPNLPLVAHNAKFDMGVVRDCCDYYAMPLPKLKYFDSLAIARATWPEFPNHKLTSLADYFNIIYKAHDALEDSMTCGKIVALAAKKWNVKTIPELLEKCNLSFNELKYE